MDEKMQVEWDAWQDVVREFRAAVGDINAKEYNPLAKAVCLWGEQLAALRISQHPHTCEKAHSAAFAAYNDVRTYEGD